ncbi:hypothetical protein KP509_1Z160500 [Ceratopteris richardii]|nr:hypothetical protein KP509_1Z160500 [Ceratopteris richardii]
MYLSCRTSLFLVIWCICTKGINKHSVAVHVRCAFVLVCVCSSHSVAVHVRCAFVLLCVCSSLCLFFCVFSRLRSCSSVCFLFCMFACTDTCIY